MDNINIDPKASNLDIKRILKECNLDDIEPLVVEYLKAKTCLCVHEIQSYGLNDECAGHLNYKANTYMRTIDLILKNDR